MIGGIPIESAEALGVVGHCVGNGSRQGVRRVADAERDELGIRVCRKEFLRASSQLHIRGQGPQGTGCQAMLLPRGHKASTAHIHSQPQYLLLLVDHWEQVASREPAHA